MGSVISSGVMSLDGYIAYDDNSVGALFDWYNLGDVEVPSASPDITFHLTPASADHWRSFTSRVGVVIVGRTLFDYTDGWHGVHPVGVPVIVVTHEPPTDWSYPGSENFHFVTGGIEAAVVLGQELAGDKLVCLAAGTIASQALAAGLLDEVAIDLVPVVLGSGRPYFTDDVGGTVLMGEPSTHIPAERVTHLVFPVDRAT